MLWLWVGDGLRVGAGVEARTGLVAGCGVGLAASSTQVSG
jgi:hypothetical protein